MIIHAYRSPSLVRRVPFSRTVLLTAASLLWLTIFQSRAIAATYYLESVRGSDTYSGTADAPWKTIAKVRTAASAGDIVHIVSITEEVFGLNWPDGIDYYANAVVQYGITWTFDTSHQIGRFANGDFWVIGPVNIASISPRWDGEKHGSMVNPPGNSGQPYDSRMPSFKPDLQTRAPVTLAANTSLISTVSWQIGETGCPSLVNGIPRPTLKTAAVLTVLGAVPPPGSFRPPYAGSAKPLYRTSQLRKDLLANLPNMPGTPDIRMVSQSLNRVWLDHIKNHGDAIQYTSPSQNMPNYGREYTSLIGKASLLLMVDEQQIMNLFQTNKDALLIRMVQLGIDLYGVVENGGYWWSGGGLNLGRKWPILFAGLMLDSAPMQQIGLKSPTMPFHGFQEDEQIFYVGPEHVYPVPYKVGLYGTTYRAGTVSVVNSSDVVTGTGTAWRSINCAAYFAVPEDDQAYRTDGKTYKVASVVDDTHLRLDRPYSGATAANRPYYVGTFLYYGHGGHKYWDFEEYTQSHIGMPEWGVEPSELPDWNGLDWGAPYRAVDGPSFAGVELAALIAGQKQAWNHNAFFDYTDRWMWKQAQLGGERCFDRWTEAMWDRYRADYGNVWTGDTGTQALTLASIGGKQVAEGSTLTFSITANNPAGSPLTFSATGLPAGATFENQTFTWTPSAGQRGSYPVTFTVSNGQDQDSETVTITVEAPAVPNSAPVLGAIGNKSIPENEILTFSVSATDSDGGPSPLTYSATGLPTGATFSGQSFSWTPGYDQAGTYQVTFVASDGLEQASEIVTVTVANVNRPPALSGLGDRSVDENNALTFSISASDPDGGSLTYWAGQIPAGANFSGQDFSWTPISGQAGTYQITFVASDGELQDSRTMNVTVVGGASDGAAPVVAQSLPEPDAIQVPTNNLTTLHVTDAGAGVNAGSVVIRVNDQIVYQGDVQVYTGDSGRCSRSGQKNDYRFIYQPGQSYDFDQTVTVSVNAADLQGNAMPEYSYSFVTEMRTFGANVQVAKRTGALQEKAPVTATDSIGNIWIVWHDGQQGNRDIYAARMAPGEAAFQTPVALTKDPQDQCNPDVAVGSDGKVYVVWQDNRRGNWDIYGSVCSLGQSFSRESRVSDSNDNEINPAIAVDSQSPNQIYVAWQDDRNGNQDIYVAVSANAFAGNTVSQVTANAVDQTEPDITADGQNVIYIVWTDMRNAQADIYGAASTAGPWTNVPIVAAASDQTDPVVAAEPGGSVLHLLWVDSAPGDRDVYYASTQGLPSSPLVGRSIVDDTSGADQLAPAIACAANGKVFACWQDSRHEGNYSADTDLYVAELVSGAARTNVLVGDEQTNASQHEPTLGVDAHGQPYVIWTDDRHGSPQIYYAATTFTDPVPVDS